MQPLFVVAPVLSASSVLSMMVFAQAITDGSQTETVFTGTVLAAAVGALVYLVRQFGSGRLVARDPDLTEKQLTRLLEDSQRLTDDVVQLLKESHLREAEYRIVITKRNFET